MTSELFDVKHLPPAECMPQQLRGRMDCFSCVEAEMRTASRWVMHTAWHGIETAVGSGQPPQVCASGYHCAFSKHKHRTVSAHVYLARALRCPAGRMRRQHACGAVPARRGLCRRTPAHQRRRGWLRAHAGRWLVHLLA